MMLLALPGGVLADSFDRRSPLITVQAYLFVVAIPLAVLAAAGQMPPALLLVFTFALGAGAAVQVPPWQAMMPELVPRTQLRAAARLDLVSVNVAYAVGLVLAGLVIAYLGGVPVVFARKAACVALFAVTLLFSRPSWRYRDLAGSISFLRCAPVAAISGMNQSCGASCSERSCSSRRRWRHCRCGAAGTGERPAVE